MLYDDILDSIPRTMKQMRGEGLFLTTRAKKLNTMVIGWGGINVYFRRPIFIVPVRLSRFTHEQMEASTHFTVSVPREGKLKEALEFCGSNSGRDHEKFSKCGLTPIPGRKTEIPVIGGCGFHYECEIIYQQHMEKDHLKKEVDTEIYPNSVYHTFYFGQIIDCYSGE